MSLDERHLGERLARLCEPGPDLAPDDPAAVRARARRRRARRRAWVGGGLAVVTAVGVVASLAVTGDSDRTPIVTGVDDGTTAPVATTTAPAPAAPSTAPPTTAPPKTTTAGPEDVRSLPPAPVELRSSAAVVWTGREMVVWGGGSLRGQPLADGAAFDPAINTWRVLAPAPLTAGPVTSVWTGRELLVWPTVDRVGTSGAAYDPETDAWRTIAAAPGTVWGTWSGAEVVAVVHTGAPEDIDPTCPTGDSLWYYDIGHDAWTHLDDGVLGPPVSTGGEVLSVQRCASSSGAVGAMAAFSPGPGLHVVATPPFAGSAVWAGDRLLLVQSLVDLGELSRVATYDPTTDDWTELDGVDAGGYEPSLVWTGREVLIAGGRCTVTSGGRDHAINPATGDARQIRPVYSACNPGFVWTGVAAIAWGGMRAETDGVAYSPGPPPAAAARPPDTVTAAPCRNADLLRDVQVPSPPAWAGVDVVTVDILECRHGYARVSAFLDNSTCGQPGGTCPQSEQVFLRSVDGVWDYLASGSGITCRTDPAESLAAAPGLLEACEALGLRDPTLG